ncbi:hypothetical protein [Flammeovirga sp. OC4]|uniref:hypothetical protein n=1 Tax=Flammeovirga sp. OC4 TaxID=1382345 RepID=UPI0005C682AF|nr:hypothetical protein [Flammeovirga sp. OC4]
MKLTEEKIKAWKEAHGEIQLIETDDGKQAVIWTPTQSLNVMKQVITALQQSEYDAVEVVLNNCLIEGDDLTGDAHVMGISKQIISLTVLPTAEIIQGNGHEIIHVPQKNFKAKVRKVNRGDVEFSSEKNGKRVPFETNISILKRIWKDTEKKYTEVLNDDRLHMAMLSVVDELKEENEAKIKKL